MQAAIPDKPNGTSVPYPQPEVSIPSACLLPPELQQSLRSRGIERIRANYHPSVHRHPDTQEHIQLLFLDATCGKCLKKCPFHPGPLTTRRMLTTIRTYSQAKPS